MRKLTWKQKNYMLEYLSDIMEDSHDFEWQSAKGAHAVLLYKMEENKINWHETTKTDVVHRELTILGIAKLDRKRNQFHVGKGYVTKKQTIKTMVSYICVYVQLVLGLVN